MSRLQPTLQVGFPNRKDELAILQYHLPFAEPEVLALTVDFLQSSHQMKLDFSARDGINILRYAIKRLSQDRTHPLSRDAAWREAVIGCLGEEALNLAELAKRRQQALGSDTLPMGLQDFFFDPDDPLRPDDE